LFDVSPFRGQLWYRALARENSPKQKVKKQPFSSSKLKAKIQKQKLNQKESNLSIKSQRSRLFGSKDKQTASWQSKKKSKVFQKD
jgi:hypothetical protein